MMISDADDNGLTLEQEIVQLALATELHQRIGRINEWVNNADIEVIKDDNPDAVTLACGDDIQWTEPRNDFPSANLVAQIALALHTGHRGPRTRTIVEIKNYRGSDPLGFSRPYQGRVIDRVWLDEMAEYAYGRVAALTAPVTKKKKLLKVTP